MINETILVIDDNVDLVSILKNHILEPLGYIVVWAPDGERGLALITQQHPDLIMLDMHMPHLDGLGVLRALREMNNKIPVIFMTTYGSEQLVIDAFRLGVRDYLVKPFSFAQVQKTVNASLQTVRLAHEKERLSRNLVAAETVRQTVTTLSHHINNHLMVVNGNLLLLQESFDQDQGEKESRENWQEMVYNSMVSVAKIEQVLQTLRHITEVEATAYFDHQQMLDLDEALQQSISE